MVRLELRVQIFSTQQKLLLSADGRNLKILGVTYLDVNIDGDVTSFQFYVLASLGQGVALGANFLSQFACHIDCLN